MRDVLDRPAVDDFAARLVRPAELFALALVLALVALALIG